MSQDMPALQVLAPHAVLAQPVDATPLLLQEHLSGSTLPVANGAPADAWS